MDPMTRQFLEDDGKLPRSYEEPGKRLGFTPEQLRLKREKSTEAEFDATLRGSILYCAERDPNFYRNAILRCAEEMGRPV